MHLVRHIITTAFALAFWHRLWIVAPTADKKCTKENYSNHKKFFQHSLRLFVDESLDLQEQSVNVFDESLVQRQNVANYSLTLCSRKEVEEGRCRIEASSDWISAADKGKGKRLWWRAG
jgi:hypothetical protein